MDVNGGDDSDEYEEIEEEIEVTDDELSLEEEEEEETEYQFTQNQLIITNKHPHTPSPDFSQELELEVHKEHLISDSFNPVVDNESKSSILNGGEEEDMEVEEEEEEAEDVEKEPSTSQDVSQKMELEVQKEHLTADSFGLINEISIAKEGKDEPTVNINDSLKSGTHLAGFDDIVSIDVKNDPVDFVVKGSLNNVDGNNSKATVHGTVEEPSIVDGKEIALAISTNDKSTEEANGVVDIEADIKKVGEQSRDDINEGQTSSSLPQIRLRSLSPVTELNVMNKKPAIICNFFAKGWCIKGGSCKFLHVKEHVSITSQKSNEDDIGVGDITAISPISLKRSQSREPGENYHLNKSHEIMPHQQEGSSNRYKDSSISNSSFRDFGGENLRLNSVEDNSRSIRLSTPTSGPLQSFSSSTWTRAHFSNGSTNRDPLHGYGSTNLLRSCSPFSISESKSHCLKDLSMDRNKVSYDDWEPSLPFRPSFPYTKNLLAPLNLYDPIRDSFEKPKSADLPKLPLRLETTISHTNRSTDKYPAISKNIESEYGSDKQSISGQNRDPYKGFLLSTERETVETYNDERNSGSNLPMEEKHKPSTHNELNSGSNSPKEDKLLRHCKDRAEAKKGIDDFNLKLQKNGMSRKKELNLDSGRDGENRESKAMRIFRVALIDFVKDLVRPTWVEGRLSKDAHKKIVKNAVEKVISTIQPNETPSTEESINQYLSISKPKMAKLVEGYVVKYGKS